MKTKIFVCSFYVSLLLFSFSLLNVKAVSPLSLSLTTDQRIYRLQYTPPYAINVGGNLTLNGSPVSDGLIALTVFQGKIGHYVRPLLFRTLATGMVPPQNWSLDLSLDVLGFVGGEFVPRTVFTRPSSQADTGPAFNVTCKTNSWLQKLYLTLTIFDAEKVPIKTINVTKIDYPMPPNSTLSIIVPATPLVNWMALGNATAYVSAFDNIPPWEYFPYRPEVSKQFTIVPSGGAQMSSQENTNNSPTQILSSINGNYNLTFKINYYQAIPSYSPWGNYTVEAFSRYQGEQAINSYTFWVKIPGDYNGNGISNAGDVGLVTPKWQQHVPPGYPADYDGNGIINAADVGPIVAYWLKSEQPLP
jgi:hypothetical protein